MDRMMPRDLSRRLWARFFCSWSTGFSSGRDPGANERGRHEFTSESTEPKKGKRIMKPKLAGRQVALAATVAAAFTFASGCSSDKGGTGESYDYSSSTTTSTT